MTDHWTTAVHTFPFKCSHKDWNEQFATIASDQAQMGELLFFFGKTPGIVGGKAWVKQVCPNIEVVVARSRGFVSEKEAAKYLVQCMKEILNGKR